MIRSSVEFVNKDVKAIFNRCLAQRGIRQAAISSISNFDQGIYVYGFNESNGIITFKIIPGANKEEKLRFDRFEEDMSHTDSDNFTQNLVCANSSQLNPSGGYALEKKDNSGVSIVIHTLEEENQIVLETTDRVITLVSPIEHGFDMHNPQGVRTLYFSYQKIILDLIAESEGLPNFCKITSNSFTIKPSKITERSDLGIQAVEFTDGKLISRSGKMRDINILMTQGSDEMNFTADVTDNSSHTMVKAPIDPSLFEIDPIKTSFKKFMTSGLDLFESLYNQLERERIDTVVSEIEERSEKTNKSIQRERLKLTK